MSLNPIRLLLATALVAATAQPAPGQGTAFTYQGSLKNNGAPANGTYDLQFTLLDATSSGNLVAGPLTNSATAVSNGLFTVTLDFGSAPFNGALRWLEIAVRTNGGGAFSTLNPRQQLTPAPYAIFANSASSFSGTVTSGQLSGGYTNPIDFSNGANVFAGSFSGQFTGSGAGLSDVWHTGGNLGTSPLTNYLGTSDNQSLVIRVNGQPAERFDPVANDAPNIVGGASVNAVNSGATGAVIAGGGTTNFLGGYSANAVSASFSSIGGGSGNWIAPGADHTVIANGWGNVAGSNAWESVIGGGEANSMYGQWAVIGGGQNNFMNGQGAVIAGGYFNTENAFVGFIGAGESNSASTNSNYSFIGGGVNNALNGRSSVIGGGEGNTLNGRRGVIAGGWDNIANLDSATIAGGAFNDIQTNAFYPGVSFGFIGGGENNSLSGPWGVIAGGFYNTNGGVSAFVGSGDYNICTTNAHYSAIGGGYQNTIDSLTSFIGGGNLNSILTNDSLSVIGGGWLNNIQGNADQSVIGGGNANGIQFGARESFVGGGYANVVGTGALISFVGGGAANTNGGFAGAIVGGESHTIMPGANNAFIGGGIWNLVGAGGLAGAIGGGSSNTVGAAAATVPGGNGNGALGIDSFAAGTYAQATNDGAFVLADLQYTNFYSTASNQLSARFSGGIVLVTGGAGMTLDGKPVLAGAVPGAELSGTYPNAVTFNNPGNSFSGNGSGLTNVNAATLGGLSSSSFWTTTGNAGTSPGANFIGTTDGQSLLIRGGFVGVGRSTAITGAESFGINAPGLAGYSGYGGMYVNVTNTVGLPFYGYAQAGGTRAWTYIDGSDANKWKLNVAAGDRVTVTTGGNVGIGTTTPDALLTVNGTADKPGGGSWAVFSDRRLKKNIHPLTGALERLMQLRGVTFEYRDPKAIHELPGIQIGMIAQEVEQVFPDWVETAANGMKRLSIHGFEALTVEALRELRAEKDARIAELEKANADMRKQLAEQQVTAVRLEQRLAVLEKAFARAQPQLAATP